MKTICPCCNNEVQFRFHYDIDPGAYNECFPNECPACGNFVNYLGEVAVKPAIRLVWRISRPGAGDLHSLLVCETEDGTVIGSALFYEKSWFDWSLRLAKKKIIKSNKKILNNS